MSDAPPIRYERLRPETIGPLQDCIRRTYGETYPFQWFYDRAEVEARLREGWLIDAIARADDGRVVGTLGLLLASPHNSSGDYSADSLAAMVDEDFRGHEVMLGLGAELYQAFKQYALAGIHLYALALHDVVQRKSTASGRAHVTGVLPSYFNRDVRVAGFETGLHRIGAVTLFQSVFEASPRRTVTLPERYAEALGSIYENLLLPRRACRVQDDDRTAWAVPEKSTCTLAVAASNHEGKLRVRRAGADLVAHLDDLIARGEQERLSVLYVDLALDDAAIDQAVDAANAAGFAFGALIPERHHTDWIRLQRWNAADVSLESMVVVGGTGSRLLRLVEEDARRVGRGSEPE